MASSTIANLRDVQAWLGTLKVGGNARVSASLFAAPRVNGLFTLIPALDPIELQITAVDPTNATLSGTATVLDGDGSTVTLQFTEPGQALLCTLTIALPSSVRWNLLTDLAVGFGSLVATLAPHPDLDVIGMSFAANLLAGSSPGVTVPIGFTVPSFDGDWILSGSFPGIGSPSPDALEALAGNNDLLSILPGTLQVPSNFQLTGFEMVFNPPAQTCSLIRLAILYDATPPWQFFGDLFTLDSLTLRFQVLTPFTSPSLHASIVARMQIGPNGPTIDVGGQFPDEVVYGELAPGTVLNVTDAFEFFHLPLPSGFPSIRVTGLGFTLSVASNALAIKLLVGDPVPLWGAVSLDDFFFDLTGAYDATSGKITGWGQLHSQLSIGSTRLVLSGSYAQGGGLALRGTAKRVSIGDVIAKIGADFGVTVPAPIGDLTLQRLSVELDTDQRRFVFTCAGTTTIAGALVAFTPQITLTWGGASFTGELTGTLVLHAPQDGGGTRDIAFTVTFSEADATITATAQDASQGFELRDLANVFGFRLPSIPPDLDLSLLSAGFTYDFRTGSLALGARSASYGQAAFVTTTALDGTREYVFLLGVDKRFSLSNLPFVGADLARIEEISVGGLLVVISSMAAITAPQAKQINTLIETIGREYPDLPGPLRGTCVVTARLDLGDRTIPLDLAMGAPGESAAAAAPAARAGRGPVTAVTASGSPDGITWFDVQQSFGPVSIQRIGALYQADQQALWFELDATLTFGPMTLTLLGLGIGSPIKSFSPELSLQGLGLAYTNAPLEIAGSLVNLAPPGADHVELEGGVTIGTGRFTLTAFGYYGDQGGFDSMFLFGDLAYDFGGPPAFFVTGLALGFGYNSRLRLPTIDQVAAFPFVQVLPTSTVPNTEVFGPDPGPQTVLDKILDTVPPWVTPAQGTLWFAAGITFTSFELVSSQALVIVENGQPLSIALVGTSRAQFPSAGGGSGDPPYAYIELDLEVELAPALGVFSAQAVLSPASFLLDPACVLDGGFAYLVWFGDNPHAGDFVLTLGGYNPGFTPPSYYPAVPPVGFHWSMDSSITISGGAYLAFTPSVMMVGGELDATYRSGNLEAWFDAHADIIVQWKPFWFDAHFGITVGASYKVDLLFTSFTVSVELGCDLELWGPPTGGIVGVDWYIISFSIPFGSSKSSQPTIDGWSDVQSMLPDTGTAGAPSVLTLAPSSGLSPRATSPAAGAADRPQDPGPAPWIVRGSQFGFATSSSVPASSATVGAAHAFEGSSFDVAPLGWTGVSATHAISIADAVTKQDVSSSFSAVPVQRNLPSQLWGAQTTGTPSADGQLVPDQLVGVSLRVNPPDLGGSAGPVDVAVSLASVNLSLPGAAIGVSGSARPAGDVPVAGRATIAAIADPDRGIASAAAAATRNAIFTALRSVSYAPATANDSMTSFASRVGCAFFAEPLLVS